MKDQKAPKKLKLSKTTLRKLSDSSLRDVAGGDYTVICVGGTAVCVDPLVATPGCTNANTCGEEGGSGPGKKVSLCC